MSTMAKSRQPFLRAVLQPRQFRISAFPSLFVKRMRQGPTKQFF